MQLFGLDGQAGAARARSANYQDPNDAFDISTTFAMGDVSYIVGTFTASNTTVDIQENLPTGASGNINALVIRALGVIIAPTITTPLTYRWQRGVVGSGIFTNVPANARYSGLTGVTLTISNLAVADSADYRVIVANATGSATSAPPAMLSVQAVTPQFVWSLPAAITTADATLNQSGTIVGAAVFGTTPTIVVLTNGMSVDFRTNDSVATATGAGTATAHFPATRATRISTRC